MLGGLASPYRCYRKSLETAGYFPNVQQKWNRLALPTNDDVAWHDVLAKVKKEKESETKEDLTSAVEEASKETMSPTSNKGRGPEPAIKIYRFSPKS